MDVKINHRSKIRFILLMGALFAVGAVGFAIGRLSVPQEIPIEGVVLKDIGKPPDIDFSLFWDAWRVLEKKYYEKNFDKQEMVYGAIKGLVASLNDPYTVFMSPKENKKFREDIAGSFEGIGAEIGIRRDQLVIIAPLENTPADRAGLRAGDRIIKIDDHSTFDLTLDEAVSLIRGPKGTTVTLHILRGDWRSTKPFSIIRDIIQIPTLKLEFKEDTIAYIKLFHFNEKASGAFAQAVRTIQQRGINHIILDLRNNPGGFLEISQEIAGWFIDRNAIITIEDFGGQRPKKEYRSGGPGILKHTKVVLLINSGSASASEILAGALRDHLKIPLIGEKTFGKGSVQELEQLRYGASLKITVAKWLTPHGTLINDKGLEPDIKVEMTDEDFEANRDPQLEKAIEVVKSL